MLIRRGFALGLLPALAAVAVSCSDEGGGDSDAGPIETGLRSIPLSAYDSARDEGGSIEVSIGDVAAVADASRLDEPEPGRDLENDVVGWTFELARGVEDDESEVTILLPYQFQNPSFVMSVEEDLGLDLGAMERYAALTALPFSLVVFGGDLELSSSLDEVANGVQTFGDGEDGEVDFGSAGRVEQLGRPVRLAQADDNVAMSLSTPAIEDWLAGGPTLADEDDYLAVATALDDAGALSAYLLEADFDIANSAGVPPEFIDLARDEISITEPFDLVGVGMTNNDGTPGNAIAYLFSSESRANDAMREIEEAWTTADSMLQQGLQIADLVDFESIDVVGSVVTVIVTPADDRDTAETVNILLSTDTPFLHT